MSCGTASFAPTNNTQAALASFPERGRFWQVPLSWLTGIAARRERRHQYAQLLELDDRLLADIGISRPDADETALKSSCIGALMWQVYR